MRRNVQFLPYVIWAFALVVIGLTTSARVSAMNARESITARVYLPLVSQEWGAAPPQGSLFGVDDSSLILALSPPAMNLALAASVSGNRTGVSWAETQPSKTVPARFDWAKADAMLLPLVEQGFSPQVVIHSNPKWAANTPCGPLYDPNDIADLVEALGRRYPQIKYWALYNEVDLTTYSRYHHHNFGCFGEADLNHNNIPDYGDYAETMRVARRALHDGNPNAKLVFGLLAYDNFDPADSPPSYPSGCCFSYSFPDRLFAYMQAHPLPAGEQYGDVLGFNNYLLYDRAYWEKRFPGDGLVSKVNALQSVMSKYGFHFPMLASEIGTFATDPQNPQTFTAQARDLAQMYIQSAASKLEQSTWWVFADYSDSCSNATLVESRPNIARIVQAQDESSHAAGCSAWKFGLLDQNLSPKPSYFAFKTAAEQLGGWTPTQVQYGKGIITYFFEKDGREKRVYYAKNLDAAKVDIKVDINVPRVRVVDMYGNVTFPEPNGKGKIKVKFGAAPVYVELNP